MVNTAYFFFFLFIDIHDDRGSVFLKIDCWIYSVVYISLFHTEYIPTQKKKPNTKQWQKKTLVISNTKGPEF